MPNPHSMIPIGNLILGTDGVPDGKTLREWRERASVTQSQLANSLGLPNSSSFSSLEVGKTKSTTRAHFAAYEYVRDHGTAPPVNGQAAPAAAPAAPPQDDPRPVDLTLRLAAIGARTRVLELLTEVRQILTAFPEAADGSGTQVRLLPAAPADLALKPPISDKKRAALSKAQAARWKEKSNGQ